VFLEEGRIVEEGPPEKLLNDPDHERTRVFLRRFLAGGAAPAAPHEPTEPTEPTAATS
jgi:ABC-type glutathione transport system ATPase component